jgi:hypothetical protein
MEPMMRNVMEVLRAKEEELIRVKREVEALRIAAPLLVAKDDPLIPPSPESKRSASYQS